MREKTLFRNIKTTSQPFHKPIYVALERIKNGKSKELVQKIRSIKDKKQINELKKNNLSLLGSEIFLLIFYI